MAASGSITGRLSVPGDRVGIVIGPKGATRRAIELEHGVDVTITAGAAPGADGDVSVRGESQAQVDAAMDMVRGYVKQEARAEPGGAAPAPRPTATTVIPDLARGAIIGKGGASIRVLQAVTGCRIQVGDPDPATSTTVITVEGPDADMVARATARVQMVVAAERLRIEVKNRSLNEGAAVSPHVHRVVQVPPSANVGAGEASSAQRAARARVPCSASARADPHPLSSPLRASACSLRPRVGLPQPSAAAGRLLHPHAVSLQPAPATSRVRAVRRELAARWADALNPLSLPPQAWRRALRHLARGLRAHGGRGQPRRARHQEAHRAGLAHRAARRRRRGPVRRPRRPLCRWRRWRRRRRRRRRRRQRRRRQRLPRRAARWRPRWLRPRRRRCARWRRRRARLT